MRSAKLLGRPSTAHCLQGCCGCCPHLLHKPLLLDLRRAEIPVEVEAAFSCDAKSVCFSSSRQALLGVVIRQRSRLASRRRGRRADCDAAGVRREALELWEGVRVAGLGVVWVHTRLRDPMAPRNAGPKGSVLTAE